jgi:hypothetical protein
VCTFLDSTIFSRWGAVNYITAPPITISCKDKAVFCLVESKILSIGQTLLYSLAKKDRIFQILSRYIILIIAHKGVLNELS